ncbi:SMP-30/gluconolactonase/LRE family protein [Pseudorhodoferax sp. Leaf267]|uniref:SMP-30/gluconolactonase/LRE family protein n=1 Tax=Pseudorhodoferax sp. Leaf267 TaxID=1736316 RepID=UPI0006F6110D|nr:SMP-30/gluconolactonase/LRE family protein [Pseudorhodoferax sp. Leaf267]KQP22558.1 gluconolactonase [Pseudorhodoferax sp. Leaf267]
MSSPPSFSRPTALSTPRCVWDAQAQLGEGALWSSRLQALWWVDILGRRLHRLQGGEQRSWAFDEYISAVAECAGSDALLVSLRHGFALFHPEQGTLRHLHRVEAEPPGNRFNDGKCDAQGRFWAGSMDFDCQAETGALYRFDADGRCTRHDTGFAVTNGPTWSQDGTTMFFNDTVRGTVLAYDFDMASGLLANRRPWLQFAEGDGVPDGMTTDAAGRLWIAHWGGGCVSCHDPVTAEELGRITLPASQITNCAFGGPALRTLYVTSAAIGLPGAPLAGAVFAVELDSPGLPAPLFAGPVA